MRGRNKPRQRVSRNHAGILLELLHRRGAGARCDTRRQRARPSPRQSRPPSRTLAGRSSSSSLTNRTSQSMPSRHIIAGFGRMVKPVSQRRQPRHRARWPHGSPRAPSVRRTRDPRHSARTRISKLRFLKKQSHQIEMGILRRPRSILIPQGNHA